MTDDIEFLALREAYLYAPRGLRTQRLRALKDFIRKSLKRGLPRKRRGH